MGTDACEGPRPAGRPKRHGLLKPGLPVRSLGRWSFLYSSVATHFFIRISDLFRISGFEFRISLHSRPQRLQMLAEVEREHISVSVGVLFQNLAQGRAKFIVRQD